MLLDLRPIVKRGIPGDPGRRSQASLCARRRAAIGRAVRARAGGDEPRDPRATGFLAEWVASGTQGPALTRFCVEAVRRLWFELDAAARPADFAELWREQTGGDPGPPGAAGRVRRNERKMCLRGIYDVPAAWVHGQWFFAHERSAQIGARLDDLGWPAV